MSTGARQCGLCIFQSSAMHCIVRISGRLWTCAACLLSGLLCSRHDVLLDCATANKPVSHVVLGEQCALRTNIPLS